jgi:hypothetical protein
MLNCKDVHRIVAEDLGENPGLMRRIEIKMHLLMCGKCSRYVEQIGAIGESIRRLCAPRPGDGELAARLETEIMAGCGPADGKDSR